jgi:hypothetical protein
MSHYQRKACAFHVNGQQPRIAFKNRREVIIINVLDHCIAGREPPEVNIWMYGIVAERLPQVIPPIRAVFDSV